MILNNRGRAWPEHGNMNNPLFQIRFLITVILLGLVFGFLLTSCGSQNDASPVFSAPSDPGGSRSFLTTWDDSIICARVKTKMISDDFVNHGTREQILSCYNLDKKGITKVILDLTRGLE